MTARDWREMMPDDDPFPEAPWPEMPDGRERAELELAQANLAARLLPGGSILDEPAMPPAVWGEGEDVLWAEGESLMIVGPDGTGKTTLAGCLVACRLGLGLVGPDVLGLPVAPGERNVLYLAMDRPRQAMRALRRLFTEADRAELDERLALWQGPPPEDLARYPNLLTELAHAAGADTVVVDSLKDAAGKLSEDETGSGWNRARQAAIVAGVELIELHSGRKAQADNRKPSKLADVYGSRWLTSGAGSVISLWGQAGDLVVEFTHLKPPANLCGPWAVTIDPDAGTMHRDAPLDLVAQVRLRGSQGITAEVAARLLYGSERPTRAETERARRMLARKAAKGVLVRHEGTRGGQAGSGAAVWFLAAPEQSRSNHASHVSASADAEPQVEQSRTPAG